MKFSKMHACGNDFILIKGYITLSPEIIKNMCDRHLGIGADGIILYDNDHKVKIYNCDGSKAKICGNGLRCLAALLYSESKEVMNTIYLDDTPIDIYMIDEFTSIIKMPIPMTLKVNNKEHLTTVMNNHYIIYVDDFDNFEFNEHYKSISKKQNCNIHAVKIIDKNNLFIKSYEYGVGYTKSCGSGALACFFTTMMLNLCNEHVNVISEGGIIHCYYKNNEYFIKGNANFVYKGEYYYGN